MIFQRAKDVPSTPKIAKISLPGGDSRTSTPRNVPPPRSMTPMTTTGEPTAPGRTASHRRVMNIPAEAPSMTGYFSEPGGGTSPTNSRRHVRVTVVPTKTEDGPSRPKLRTDGDVGSATPSRRTSRIIPQNTVPFVAPALTEESRTLSRTREPQAPVILTPRPRRPSVIADITPRPRKPSIAEERPPPVGVKNDTRPPVSEEKIPSILKKNEKPTKGETPRKRTSSLSQQSTVPDIHWRLLPYDQIRSKQCQHFNIALPPDEMITSCRPTCRNVSPKDMSRPAAAEKITNMVIVSLDLPWKIVVDRPGGISCLDVFQAIHDAFDVPLTDKDRARFPQKVKQCKKAFELRCRAVPRLTALEERLGMKRVDLLNCKTYFHGLIKPGAEEPWLMILGPTPPCSRTPSM